jgi:hypothetical protein
LADCPVSPSGKHQRGVSGCGCKDDPLRKAAIKPGGKSGGKNPVKVGKHKHDYSLNGRVKEAYDEKAGEWVEFWPMICLNNEDGKCPAPKIIELHRRKGPPPR